MGSAPPPRSNLWSSGSGAICSDSKLIRKDLGLMMNEKGPKYAKLLELIGDVCRFSLLIYVVLHVVTWSWSWRVICFLDIDGGKYQDRVTGRCLWANILGLS